MNVKELRVGNLVNFMEDSTIMEITEIADGGFGVKYSKEETWIELSQFEPIAISREWLLKLGLRGEGLLYMASKEIYEESGRDIGIKAFAFFFNERLGRWMETQTRVCVDYIHQVQNLTFALTGQELTIK